MLADLIDLAGSPVALLYGFGLSLSLAGIVFEASLAAALRRPLYSARDTAANLVLYAGFFALNLVWARSVFALYAWTSDRALVQWPIGGFHLGQDGLWWEWLALFLLEDLCFYLFHRASHRCRILWASHVTHHSSQHFNLSVAFRQTWVPFLGVVFWLPLLLLGFDPLMVMSVQVFSLFYQELLHTQLIPRLGPLEWIFNTPRHHAVHHGSNPVYLDRNYGGVLILWDRLLGTWAGQGEPIRFGLTTALPSHNPVVIAFHEWAAMARGLVRARSPAAALRELFGPPGNRSARGGRGSAALPGGGDRIFGHRGGRAAGHLDELAAAEVGDRALNGALGQASAVAQHLVAEEGALAPEPAGHGVEPQVEDERRRPLVVADQIGQEDVHQVLIDREPRARHPL